MLAACASTAAPAARPLQIATAPASPAERAYFAHVTVAAFGDTYDERGYALIFGQRDLPPLPPGVAIVATFRRVAGGEIASVASTKLVRYRACEGKTGCGSTLPAGLTECDFASPPLLATPGDYKVTFRSTGGALQTGEFGLVIHPPPQQRAMDVDHWR